MAFYQDRRGVLRLQEFEQWPWLVHGFSTRRAGTLGDGCKRQAREKFLRDAGARAMKLVTVRQIHSSIVRIADTRETGLAGDSLVSAKAGLLAGIRTADCFPILLVDPRRRAVAAVHAGWRGLARRVAEKTVGEMRRAFSCDPGDLRAAIGPGIQACCFEVGGEVIDEFKSQFIDAAGFCRCDTPDPAQTRLPLQLAPSSQPHPFLRPLEPARGRVDLAKAARRQLLAGGLAARHIFSCGRCTACEARSFYSYRREKETAGRMLAVIGVREGR